MSGNRRSVLQAALGTTLGLLLPECARAQAADPRNARPQEGDRLPPAAYNPQTRLLYVPLQQKTVNAFGHHSIAVTASPFGAVRNR